MEYPENEKAFQFVLKGFLKEYGSYLLSPPQADAVPSSAAAD
jgi:hypothetical protein